MKMDASGCDMCAANALASFHGKIKEAITLVRSMSTGDKLKAVQYWNVVSENLQDVVNSSADDISALQSQLCERESMILLQNPRAPPAAAGSLSHHQPPSSQEFAVIRRSEPNTIGGHDIGPKQNGVAVIGSDIVDHYLGSQPPAATTGGGQLTAPVMVDEYESFNDCEVLDDPLAEPVASVDMRNDFLGTVETEESEPVSRDMDHLSVPPSVDAGGGLDRVGEVEDEMSASPTPNTSDVQTDRGTGEVGNGEITESETKPAISESVDFQKYLSFAQNETGVVVLNLFTRQPNDLSSKENDGNYQCQCNVCQRLYPSLAEFYSHFAVHWDRLVCCKCGQTCISKTLYRAHMLTHSKSLLKCMECGRAFTTFSNLSRHMRTHTGERRFECSVCHKRFAERKDLRTHSRLHSGERPYQCSQCPARFIQQGALSAHLRHHSGERPHLCDLCGKTFAQLATLKDHKLRHEGQKRFPCDRCPMAFNVRNDLKRHRHIHLPEHPHKCSQCGKSFPRPQALAEHMNRHFGKRPYRCSLCLKGYANQSACRKHTLMHAREASMLRSQPDDTSPGTPDT